MWQMSHILLNCPVLHWAFVIYPSSIWLWSIVNLRTDFTHMSSTFLSGCTRDKWRTTPPARKQTLAVLITLTKASCRRWPWSRRSESPRVWDKNVLRPNQYLICDNQIDVNYYVSGPENDFAFIYKEIGSGLKDLTFVYIIRKDKVAHQHNLTCNINILSIHRFKGSGHVESL